ncbi:MAG: type II toxin-antitoxin system RelB/DinJ family antitoxin [Candidatus Puniceispirillum sp.]|jgi:DNA-damage-inducible protein J|nr:type II toxin-antitoxin system RelB/DinJ family antitoxin [Candidatus Puniceispirillum sp.]MBL6673712.1 type II toxin-antitoxin system RelB/DinJ family antitoxin [Candidatus Puniceispirillum sp.]
MARTETIRARVEPALKSEAEAILKKIGLSSSEAMRLFLYQVVQQRGLPFEVKIPNAETIAAIEELETGKGIRVNSVEELFDDAD